MYRYLCILSVHISTCLRSPTGRISVHSYMRRHAFDNELDSTEVTLNKICRRHLSLLSLFLSLQAVLIVADKKMSLEVSGVGDVLESHDGILGVGSGGPYAVGKRI